MRFAQTAFALGSALVLVAACSHESHKAAVPWPWDIGDAGPIGHDTSLVTKFPATPISCWKDHACTDGKVCAAAEDPTFGGCPVPGCRERALGGACKSNRDCFAGYGCVLGPSQFVGPGNVWHCEEIRCAADADCFSRNLTCRNGACAAIACTSDADCDGYCIGVCSAKPGTCVVFNPDEPKPQ